MGTADYLVLLAIIAACFVNQQALVVIFAFAVNELLFNFVDSWFWYCSASCVSYSLIHYLKIKSIKVESAMLAYSFLFFCYSVDAILSKQETLIYVTIPYVIKLIDIFLIFHLLNIRGVLNGFVSRSLNRTTNSRFVGL